MQFKYFLPLLLLLILCSTLPAAPITGLLFFTGDARVGTNLSNWLPSSGGLSSVPADSGHFKVHPSSTGYFSALVAADNPEDGQIETSSSSFVPGSTFDASGPLLRFSGAPVMFQLTSIDAGAFEPCSNASWMACSVSRFNLINMGSSVMVNFNVAGQVREQEMLVSTFTGSFAMIFNNESIGSLLGRFASQAYVDSSYTANFSVEQVPEPGTLSLLGAAGAFFGLAYTLRKRS